MEVVKNYHIFVKTCCSMSKLVFIDFSLYAENQFVF
jgi:hypothetical protein